MNLSAYDKLDSSVNPNKSWLDISFRRLVTNEVVYRDKYILLNKYNPVTNSYSYFVCICDNPVEGYKTRFTRKDKDGNTIINLSSIWNMAKLDYLTTNINVDIKCVDRQDDGEIYEIDI